MPKPSLVLSGRHRACRASVLLLAGALMTLSAGCSGGVSLGNLFGGGSGDRTAGVYYASEAGTKLYAKASFTSAVTGHLSLHQKVVRSQLDHGFAYVEVAGSGKKGWVENAKLIWKIPSQSQAAGAVGPSADQNGGGDQGSDHPAEIEREDEPVEDSADGTETTPVETEGDSPVPEAQPVSDIEGEQSDSDPALFNPF